ncbi:MAG: quinol:electron acceptor oxidoreductase subunit ActD, partial [Ignavibacteria bacterium]
IGKILKKFDDRFLASEPRTGELYAVAALFDTPDQIIHAAEKVSGDGYKKFDVLTPYPVHGMDDAMNLKPSGIGWIGLLAGMSGTSLAFLMIWWMVGVNYPNIFGGKPFFNIPASIPIMFELTVLISALTLVGSLISIFMKLPANANPLMDTDFMKSVTSEKYGIYIEAKDPKFKLEEVRAMFEGLGASSVSNIHDAVYDVGDTKNLLLSKKFVGAMVGTSLVTIAVTYLTLNVLLFLPPFDWMHFQPRVDPQTDSKFFKDGFSMRRPVEGTVARGFMPYEFKGMPDSMVVVTPNPLPVNQKVLDLGKKRFDTYCSPCHGYYGKGDSRLRGQFPAPPSLHSVKVTNWKDANIYHVITNGQNTMPSYASSISRDDRWAIIHYLRVLQRSQNASDSDVVVK